MKTLQIKTKHLVYSSIAFTIGYFISKYLASTQQWPAYLTGLLGSLLGYTIVVYIIE